MENTEKVLFEDDRPQWYIALGDRWIGPLSASDVYERVLSQKITWAYFVWKEGQKEWMRLCDVRTFAGAVPQQPSKRIQQEVIEKSKETVQPAVKQAKPAAARKTEAASASKASAKAAAQSSSAVGSSGSADEKGWFLYYNETQFGPFSKEEVARFLDVGKINPRVHAWRTGLATWTRIETIESFKSIVKNLKPVPEKSKAVTQAEAEKQKIEQRKTPRRPMIAKILLANQNDVSEAVCRDISVGGMQVLTDRVPGEVGQKVRLNVSSSAIDPFVAEGVIVRLLEDRKGFSFRFDRLTDQAKRSIERYIDSPQ
jgi:hypothetical protein